MEPSDGHSEGVETEPDIKIDDYDKDIEDLIAKIESEPQLAQPPSDEPRPDQGFGKGKEVKFSDNEEISQQRKRYQYNKQHTGLKNLSFNVGAAVTPTDKMQFDQEEPESFGIVKINRPIGNKLSPNVDNTDAVSTISSVGSEGLTDQGYFDLKFYHNKLW